MEHKTLPTGERHPPCEFELADAPERLATNNPNTGVAYTTDDLKSFAYQEDDEWNDVLVPIEVIFTF